MTQPLVLITGATGAVGPRIVQAMLQAGHRVRTLSVDGPAAGILPSEIENRLGDVTDSAAVQSAMQGVETVIHMAALLHIVNPLPALREKYYRVNVDGTTQVVDAALQAGVRRVLLFSTIAVYGYPANQLLTEESPVQPDTLYAQTKLAAERIVGAARREDGQPLGTVLRLGAVYGSRIKGNYSRLVQALARGRFVSVGDGGNRRTLVYDRDVARAVVLAATHPAAAGRVYNVTDGAFHPVKEIVAAICAALNRRPPRISVPLGPVRLAAGLFEDGLHLIGRRSAIGRATIDKYIEEVLVDGRRLQAELGFVPRYDLRAGWQETILEMRQNGQL